jgi:hypothetical protein
MVEGNPLVLIPLYDARRKHNAVVGGVEIRRPVRFLPFKCQRLIESQASEPTAKQIGSHRIVAASPQTITVAYATANGTATAGSDYQAASGCLTFAPGETSKTITVQVVGDRLPESNETFFVNLSSPTNSTVADGQGAGTIFDDEPRISISDVTKYEGKKGHTTLFTFTVTPSAAYDSP